MLQSAGQLGVLAQTETPSTELLRSQRRVLSDVLQSLNLSVLSKPLTVEPSSPVPYSHLGMLMSLLRGRRATLLKAILTPTATTSVKEITPPIT